MEEHNSIKNHFVILNTLKLSWKLLIADCIILIKTSKIAIISLCDKYVTQIKKIKYFCGFLDKNPSKVIFIDHSYEYKQ